MRLIFSALILVVTNSHCGSVELPTDPFTYLALGDSYTIGQSVAEEDRWPVQLVDKLVDDGIQVQAPRIIARTGWTTDELIQAIDDASVDETYDMVSLLIGVNNQYRGYPIDQYNEEFEQLLNTAIEFAGGTASSVFVVSIPDYGVTPFSIGSGGNLQKIAREIDEYNVIAKRICEAKGVSFVSITEGSKRAKDDATLIAEDGLHPSGKMYAEWVDAVYPFVFDDLSSR